MTPVTVAVNGFGRIGRAFVRLAHAAPDITLVAINDLTSVDNAAYLFTYDSVYGRSSVPVRAADTKLVIGERSVPYLSIKDPRSLPWRALGVDVVVEATGVFDSYTGAAAHLEAGARRVVISAPAKGAPPPGLAGATVLMGINDEALKTCRISSNASCTTNAVSPVMEVLDEAIGIERAVLSTVHAYTATQKLVDGPDEKDFRRGRAAGASIVPSTTGAARSVVDALPRLAGKFDGIALRVPVLAGSLADITFVSTRSTTIDEVNAALRTAAATPRWNGLLAVTDEPLVSVDIVGRAEPAIVDLSYTRVVDGTLVKVLSWYDNELGYAHTLLRHVRAAAAA